MSELARALGRNVVRVNLDFAAEETFDATVEVDVRDLVTLSDAMAAHSLGPNGALLFCAEVLERNVDWLETRIKRAAGKEGVSVACWPRALGSAHAQRRHTGGAYLLIDCPGLLDFLFLFKSRCSCFSFLV